MAIQRKDKDLTEKYGVCELHLTDDCIDRFFDYSFLGETTTELVKRDKRLSERIV